MSRIERMLGDPPAPFEDTIAAIEACAAMPGATPEYATSLHRYKLIAMDVHHRADSEVRAALDQLAAADPPLLYRSLSTIAACAKRAAVAADYLPPLIRALQAAASGAGTDAQPFKRVLEDARRVCERLGVDLP